MENMPLFSIMKDCLKMAEKAAQLGEVPVGAIIYNTQSKEPLSHGFNLRESTKSCLGHAEIVALHKACRKAQKWRLSGYSMAVTLEPCVMCYGALVQSRIDGVIWAAPDPKGGAETAFSLHSHGGHNHKLNFQKANLGLEIDSSQLLKEFFRARR